MNAKENSTVFASIATLCVDNKPNKTIQNRNLIVHNNNKFKDRNNVKDKVTKTRLIKRPWNSSNVFQLIKSSQASKIRDLRNLIMSKSAAAGFACSGVRKNRLER